MATANIYKWGLSIMMASGLTGNAISVVVLSQKAFANLSSSFYMRAMCLADCAVIAYMVIFLSNNGFGFRLDSVSDAACKIRGMLNYVPIALSAWIEALICLDRLLTIVAPGHFKILTKKLFWYSSVAFLLIYNLAIYSPNWYFYQLPPSNPNETRLCSWDDDYYAILGWIDLFNSTIVPFILMLLSTIGISLKLTKSRSKVASSGDSQLKARKKRDLMFAITSISLNMFFLICNIGIVVFSKLGDYGIVSRGRNPYLFAFVIFFLFTNYTGKFYLYLIVNRTFRIELLKLLCGSTIASLQAPTITVSSTNHTRRLV